MDTQIYNIFEETITITSFVFVMMLIIEYINVHSKGFWIKIISKNKWKQYLLASLLGAIPGCLGAFTAVALFSHRLISFGAIVAAMIATSGDEAFVMFAMFPQKAALLTIIILVLGVFAGYLTDKIYTPKKVLAEFSDNDFPLHEEEKCKCFEKNMFFYQFIHPSVYRLILFAILSVLLISLLTGWIAGSEKLWIKISLALVISFSLFIVISVPDHFLKLHIWDHIVKEHIPKIFLWTFGTLLAIYFLMNCIDIHLWLSDNMLVVLIVAILIGIIPESGPHLIFVTLFFQGAIPFSVLLASSISQDGHGSLPLLAESKQGFLAVKLVNIVYALIFGLIGYLTGF